MSLAKTYLQDIRAKYPSNLDRDELRITQTGLLTTVLAMTTSSSSIVTDDVRRKAEQSVGRILDIPVMDKGVITISNVRSCTITGGQSESDLIRVVWKTVAASIKMVPSQYVKNEIGYQLDLAKKLREIVEAFKVEIENDIDTALDANKTTVYNSAIVGTDYTLTGAAIQVPVSKQDFFFNDIEPINFSDDFYNPTVKIVASPSVMSVVNKYINQGAGNAANTNFQYAGKDFGFSNRITVASGKRGTGYFMPDGSIALLTRVDLDSQADHKAGDGTEWMEETLPGLPFPVGIQFKSVCADQSAIETSGQEHLKATLTEFWQISFDYAILTPYNSDSATKPGAIRKFEFVP